MALILQRPWDSQPQEAVELRAEYAGAEVLMIGASRFNQGGSQPTFSAQTITGVDGGGLYFGTSASAGGVITIPSSAAMQDGSCSGVARVKFPALANFLTIASNGYDRSAATTDLGWVLYCKSTGQIQLELHDSGAAIVATATGKVVAGGLHTVAWSYDRTSGAAAVAIDGTLYTATSVQATQTVRTKIGIGGYYDTNTSIGAAEKRFYLSAVWPRPRSAAEVLALSTQPLRIFEDRRIYIPGAVVGGGGVTGTLAATGSSGSFSGAANTETAVAVAATGGAGAFSALAGGSTSASLSAAGGTGAFSGSAAVQALAALSALGGEGAFAGSAYPLTSAQVAALGESGDFTGLASTVATAAVAVTGAAGVFSGAASVPASVSLAVAGSPGTFAGSAAGDVSVSLLRKVTPLSLPANGDARLSQLAVHRWSEEVRWIVNTLVDRANAG